VDEPSMTSGLIRNVEESHFTGLVRCLISPNQRTTNKAFIRPAETLFKPNRIRNGLSRSEFGKQIQDALR